MSAIPARVVPQPIPFLSDQTRSLHQVTRSMPGSPSSKVCAIMLLNCQKRCICPSVAQLSRLMSLWLKPSPGPTSRPEAAVPWRSLHLQHLVNQSCAPLTNPHDNMKDNQALSWPLSLEGLSCCVLVFQQPNCCTAAPAEVSPASCWVRHLCLPGPSLTTQIKQPTKLSSYLSSAVSSASCRP